MGNAEVQDLRAGRSQDDVLRLHVPVDDALGVHGSECGCGASSQRIQTPTGQGAVSRHVPVEGEAGYVGRDEPRRRGLGVGVADRNQAWPGDALGELHFPPEASTELIVCGLCRMHDLDGDALACGRDSGVHRAHAAGSKPPHDTVGTHPTWIAGLHRLNTVGHDSSPRRLTAHIGRKDGQIRIDVMFTERLKCHIPSPAVCPLGRDQERSVRSLARVERDDRAALNIRWAAARSGGMPGRRRSPSDLPQSSAGGHRCPRFR